MKRILLAALLAFSVPAFAYAPTHHHHYTTSSDSHEIGGEGEGYTNVDGRRVHSPKHASSRPPEATAQCRDGSRSFSQHHRGTCSYHGGVDHW